MSPRLVPVEEMLAKKNPRISDVSLSFKNVKFWVFEWEHQLWVRGREIELALDRPLGYVLSWAYRSKGTLGHESMRVTMVNNMAHPAIGGRRKIKSTLFSLSGVVGLMKLIGTPEALELGVWAKNRADDYEFPPPNESGSQ